MVHKQKSLKALREEIVKEKSKIASINERASLENELKGLRSSQSNKVLKRVSRGFSVLVKKGAKATGKGVVKLRKFAEESGAAEGLDFGSRAPVQRKVRVVRRKPKITTRRIKVRPRMTRRTKRRAVRREPVDDGGFFNFDL